VDIEKLKAILQDEDSKEIIKALFNKGNGVLSLQAVK